MHHEIKIDPPYFEAVITGKKTFEIRYNDRGYNAGDTVTMLEYSHTYTGRSVTKRIGYVTSYGQKENLVVFSLLTMPQPDTDGES